MGETLYRHAGWARGWEVLKTGLADESNPLTYPDQFVVINDKIVWTNGINQPLVIDAHGAVHPLGFSSIPSAPSVSGPQQLNNKIKFYPNAAGYTWKGEIGTPGDVLDGVSGAILDGAWYYYVQYEDVNGNLSPLSPPSSPALIKSIQADPYEPGGTRKETCATLEDMTRQFIVRMTGQGPEHTVAIHVYRTSDTKRVDNTPRFLTRVSGRELSVLGDRVADAYLGEPVTRPVVVPTFRVMCVHQGRLIIGNTPSDPGIVRRSEPGFPGTFLDSEYVYPDLGGNEITALVSHMGTLLAFTETAVYDISDFANPQALAQGVGCAAPRSIAALPNGNLVWLSRDGFYAFTISKAILPISVDIHKTLLYDMNTTRYRQAVATVDTVSKEYQCALAPAGESRNRILFCFDNKNWRRQDYGTVLFGGLDFPAFGIADMCTTNDYRRLTLVAAFDGTRAAAGLQNDIMVKGREAATYSPNVRTVNYRTGWFFADNVGATPVHLRTLYLGMIDSYDGTFTIRFFRNGSWDPVLEMTDVRAVGVDDGSNVVRDIAGAAVIGTMKAHEPRLFWRQIPVGLENVSAWAFEIVATYPTRINIAAIGYDQTSATGGNVRGRIPLRADV
jgi:hypothetical protein